MCFFFFFLNDPATTEIYTLPLPDALPICGTAEPWRDAGYTVEYRQFYPHLARTDLARYRVLIFLLGREPEAPSDALTTGDLAFLNEWVRAGGGVVLGYDADGEGRSEEHTSELQSRLHLVCPL